MIGFSFHYIVAFLKVCANIIKETKTGQILYYINKNRLSFDIEDKR